MAGIAADFSGAPGPVPTMRAVFRDGIGCIILPPDQTLADAERLPESTLPYPPGDPARTPWPDGDWVEPEPLSENVDAAALLDKIGMRNTLVSTDRIGDFILSSQVYTNARDLARFDLLYLQNGVWNGERLLSEAWIDFVRTPAPATAEIGNMYGGQFWLVADDRDDVPPDAYMTNGNRGLHPHRPFP